MKVVCICDAGVPEMLMQYMMASITARLGEEERAEF